VRIWRDIQSRELILDHTNQSAWCAHTDGGLLTYAQKNTHAA